jgi:mRNA-processing protein COX24
VQDHVPVGEPAAAPAGQRLGFGLALEAQDPGVKGLSLVFCPHRHGQLHVIESHQTKDHLVRGYRDPLACCPDMGSLIKKRRKRMRKKKHKKMLKATRWQRRAGK